MATRGADKHVYGRARGGERGGNTDTHPLDDGREREAGISQGGAINKHVVRKGQRRKGQTQGDQRLIKGWRDRRGEQGRRWAGAGKAQMIATEITAACKAPRQVAGNAVRQREPALIVDCMLALASILIRNLKYFDLLF